MFIDSHCHLDLLSQYISIEKGIDNAAKYGITKFINPALYQSHWKQLIALEKLHNSIKIGLGLHPCFISRHSLVDLEYLDQLIISNNIKFIGEIGMDKRFINNYEEQEVYFIEQLKIAKKHEIPVILHSVKSNSEIIRIIKLTQFKNGGIIHAFNGSIEEAIQFIHLNFKLGIGPICTYPHNKKIKNIIENISLNNLVIETDSPDMKFYNNKKAYSEPANLIKVFNIICKKRKESLYEIQEILWHNTHKTLNL